MELGEILRRYAAQNDNGRNVDGRTRGSPLRIPPCPLEGESWTRPYEGGIRFPIR